LVQLGGFDLLIHSQHQLIDFPRVCAKCDVGFFYGTQTAGCDRCRVFRRRVILRRLGIFAGAFPIEAAAEITADPEVTASDVVGSVANLVSKSLVVAEVGGVDVRYRLLDTTRAYALQKLNESNEFESLARRQAEFFLHLFERAETERQMAPAAEWLAAYRWHIDDVRSALDWAFSPRGDVALGVALTVAAVPLWTHMSLNEECRSRVAAALASPGLGASQGNRREMQLSAALGGAHIPEVPRRTRISLGQTFWPLQNKSAIRIISCGRSGACGRLVSTAASSAPH